MLRWAIVFALISLVAGALGFGYLSESSAGIAKIFALVFLVLFIISLIFGRKALGGPTV